MLPSVASACIIALLSVYLPSPVLADKKGNLVRILKKSKDGNMIKGKLNINIPVKTNIKAKKGPKDTKKKTWTKEKKGKKKTINPISNHKPKPNPVSNHKPKPKPNPVSNPRITSNPIVAPTPNPSTKKDDIDDDDALKEIPAEIPYTTIPTANPSKKDKSDEYGTRSPKEIPEIPYKIKLDHFENISQTDARKLYLELEHDPDEFWETDIKKAMKKSKNKINGVGALLICNKTPLNYMEHFEHSDEEFDREKMTDFKDENEKNGVEAFKLSSNTPLNSGLKRFQEIKKYFFPDAEVNYANVFTLINSEEETCWSLRTNIAILQKFTSLKPPLCGIPITGPMKLALGTVDGALGRDPNKHMISRPRHVSPELETSKVLVSFWRDLVDQSSLSTLDDIFKEFIDDFKKTKDVDTRARRVSLCEQCTIAYDGIKYNSNEKSRTVTIERLTPTPKCYLCFIDYISRKKLVASISPIIDMAPASNDANLFIQSSGTGTDENMPFFQEGLTGKGQVIQVSDTGLDLNHAFFFDSNSNVQVSLEGVVNTQHRKVVQYVSLNPADVFDKDGHGTHVSGSIAGMEQGNQLSEQPGIAPNSKIAVFKIFDSNDNFLLKDFEDMLALGQEAGAYIHNASWTSKVASNKYSKWTEKIDKELFKNEMQLFLTSAGNFGHRENMSLGSIGVSKNAITVGALTRRKNLNSKEGYDCVAGLSSRGPTSDGRIKPDLVAPGTGIFSALSQEVDTTDNQEGESSTQTVKDGTSMSTAIMSGAAALVREYFIRGYYRNDFFIPSAALIKATLLNGAQDVKWNNIGGIINAETKAYDSQQGFGSVNLVKTLPLKENFSFFLKDKVNILDDEQHVYKIRKFNKNNCDLKDFSATITWMDEAGQKLMNDIDLFATMKNYNGKFEILYPNGQSERDKRNNVERIRVPIESNNEVTLYVRGTNINFTNRVKYAIVASGCW
eukprot:CAMPEP_0194306492 /NCGR_PEP_ID=MMETSP0171-20130528/3622_1 /TAXON_ID=218684 /ORGANISM="Corethron pennatum, Strain L29A3" /LENGTH=956 /DNA_ID=CAMNT_0039058281 /DNA_START=105 /DNA_END=2975 /DNA_ORIENTATION=+